ncbi:hypothetical protein KR038_008922 [Drosophila bunnanda]|nr:hypothetical protein KR038_008922 [Drosophila bunnanda]
MTSPKHKCKLNYLVESTWDPRYLRAKCKELGIESEYNAYQIRLFRSFVGVFCALHISVTFCHCVLIATLSEHKKYIYIDIGLYTGSCLILVLILSINFWEKLTETHSWIMFVSSTLACLALVSADLTQSIYHHHCHDWQCGSFYDTYIVYMIYFFLPILCIKGTILLGITVTIMYNVIFGTVMASQQKSIFGNTALEIVQYLTANVLGIYWRVLNDMVVRSSFIDRHQFIKEEFSLRNAQRQEKQLLDSILPPQFSVLLQKEIKERIILSTRYPSVPIQNFGAFRRSMVIQTHPDVSILYADVVNYTHLTTTLTVEKLVTTLHDLYARFDLAAQRYSVQRIKFLGDCYYCVAGLADTDPDHANNAVALGIAMIADMQEVREAQELNINMRIGVHSGSLYAGVIGESKLQYDIWGPDVTIANVLESTGVPGAVHISEATLRSLTVRYYAIESGPEKAKTDPILQKYRIKTYLIASTSNSLIEVDSSSQDIQTNTKTDTHLTNSSNTLFNEELHQEYRKMPVIRFDFKTLISVCRKQDERDSMSKKMDCCLTFYKSDLEKAYLRQADYLFKYHMLLAWFLGTVLIYMEILNDSTSCKVCWAVDFFIFLFLTALSFISWYKQICWMIFGKNKLRTYNRISCTIFRMHEKIQEKLTVRICTYLFVIISNWILIIFITMNCQYKEFILNYIEERIYHYEPNQKICFLPWNATDMISAMISMTFTFSHIPFLLKTSLGLGHVIIAFIFIFLQFDFVFHHSITTNPFFPSEFAHSFLLIITFVIMYLKARQTEFYKKVNFQWRVELEKKKKDTAITNRSIIILLNNILPNHVVDIYLSSLSHNELYYENYKMVSVMFAMLSNFEMNMRSLRILNEIITQFDLLYYREFYVVEKIKVVNCTYMAACGLDINFVGTTSKPVRAGSLNEEKQLQLVNNEDRDEVVYVMASFALDLMRTLANCNKAYNGIVREYDIMDGEITIGISSGEIMAGIVGVSKPHYDIWGDPVNMAARMEMTGLSGHIQVTEESANILQGFGIEANYRGLTFVKGRGLLPTYFLGIDENYNFIRNNEGRKPSHSHRSAYISLESTYA